MLPLTEAQVRAAIVNASPEERARLALPVRLAVADWDYLDFLAWADPQIRGRAYVLVERAGIPTGLVLRAAAAGGSHAALCNLCHTMQPGGQVRLFSARRAGAAGERGDSVGTYACADLGCHDNVRLAAPLAPGEVRANVDRRIDGTRHRVEAFVERVLDDL